MWSLNVDCAGFLETLEGFLEGKLAGAERRAAERHLDRCPSCREIERLARSGPPVIDPPADLAGSVLELTSGSPCARAESLLCDYVDGRAEKIDAELIRLHVGSCPDCAALSRVLARMSQELPSLAEIAPDPGFLRDVMRATLPVHARLAQRLGRWRDAWQGLLQRPRIAWEGAYLGTFVLALVFGAPGSPLAAVPQKALELARANPVRELKAPVVEIEARVSVGFQDAWQTTGRKATGTLERIKSDLGTVWDRFASEEENDEDEASPAERGPAQGDRR